MKVFECRHFPEPVFLALIPAFKKVIIELISNLKANQNSDKSSQSIRAFLTLAGLYIPKMNKATYLVQQAFFKISRAHGEISDLVLELFGEMQSTRFRKTIPPVQANISADVIPDYIAAKVSANVKANQASDAIKCLESII